MNRGELKTEILIRSGKDTTSAWTSESFINDWIDQAHQWAAGYKPWPFTEGRVSTTYTSASEEWNFEGYKADSFRFIEIGGKQLTKLSFEQYKRFKEDRPSDNDRVCSDFGATLLINTLADVSGTLTVYGQYQPANIADGDGNDTTNSVFNGVATEGDEAIIEEVLSKIANRDTKPDEATLHHTKAEKLLDRLWSRYEDEQYKYKSHPKSEGMFKRFDVLKGRDRDDSLNSNQFID